MQIGSLLSLNYGIANRLNSTTKNITNINKQLSTGQRINSGADSPSEIGKVSRFEAQIRGRQVADRNIQEGIALAETAESAFDNMEDMGEALKDLSVQYQNGILSAEDKKSIETEAKSLVEEIGYVVENTKYGGKSVFDKQNYNIQTGPNSGETYNLQIPALSINVSGNTPASSLSTMSLKEIKNENKEDWKEAKKTGSGDWKKIKNEGKEEVKTIQLNNQATNNTNTPTNSLTKYTLPIPPVTVPNQNGFNGYKKILNTNGKLMYEGSLKDGKFDGFGVLYKDGTKVYDGAWSDGKYNGYGTIYNENGSIKYQGDIKNGTPDGWGSYYSDNGKMLYQGGFKDGYREGWGTTYDNNGKALESKHYSDYTQSQNTKPPTTPGDGSNNGGTTNPPNTGGGSGTNPTTPCDPDTPKPTNPNNGTGNTGGNDTGSQPTTPTTPGDTGTIPPIGNGGNGTTPPTQPPTSGNGSNEPGANTGNTGGGSGTNPTTPCEPGNTKPTPTNPNNGSGNTGGTGNGTTPTNPKPTTPTVPSCPNDNDWNKGPIRFEDLKNLDIKKILNPDFWDTFLDKIRGGRTSLGISKNVLESRLSFNSTMMVNEQNALSKIQNVDVAKKMFELTKQQMLLQSNLFVLTQSLQMEKDSVLQLLR